MTKIAKSEMMKFFDFVLTLLYNNCNNLNLISMNNVVILFTPVSGFQRVVKHCLSPSSSWAMDIFIGQTLNFTLLTITPAPLLRFPKFRKLNNSKFYSQLHGVILCVFLAKPLTSEALRKFSMGRRHKFWVCKTLDQGNVTHFESWPCDQRNIFYLTKC